jgi:predicted RecA/RadA family phage recombinase
MRNFVQSGNSISIPAPANVTGGQGLLVGVTFGVVGESALSGQLVALHLEGVYDLPKVAAQTPAVGAVLFWDNVAGNVTTTVGTNTRIGVCCAVPGAADPTIRVRLNGSF